MEQHLKTVLNELHHVFFGLKKEEIEQLVSEIVTAEQIVCIGAGRVGLVATAFAKRLSHLGKESYWIQDATLPALHKTPLVIIASGSGETETMVTYAQLTQRQGHKLALVTANEDSRIKSLADVSVVLRAPNKTLSSGSHSSIQPMTTLFEQSAFIFFDALVLELMDQLGVTEGEMSQRHNLLE